mgnify:FL=1
MPEIPDIEAYIEALRSRVVGGRLLGVRLASPFLLRTVEPPLQALENGTVDSVERLAKRIVFEVSPAAERGRPAPAEPLFVVLHLMIAGRLHWKVAGAPVPKGAGLVAFDFEDGCLIVTEAGKKRRASLRVVRGREELAALDPGGLEVAGSTMAGFAEMLRRENHTLKRALTDPHIVSGIGNAYSDEMRRLHEAATAVLSEWTERLRTEARQTFPEKVTAFRPDMAVHGRFGMPCPVCGAKVQRIVYAQNECDYCPVCQTGGRVLDDRSLSRLLRGDWQRVAQARMRPPTADESDPGD